MKGLFVPVSKNKEWLIKWWWMNYTLNSALPLTFIKEDEVSEACEKWCKERSSHQEFDVTLWIEPWCQICGPLEPLFECAECELGCQTFDSLYFPADLFVFKKDSKLLDHWDDRIDFLKKNKLPKGHRPTILNWHAKLSDLRVEITDLTLNSLYKLSF